VRVDPRGLRYPLVNGLRLSHHPKGDLTWGEVDAAWAQAAQLLLFVGGTAGFASRDLRVVPLTSCAKIIEVGRGGDRRIVHSLGKDALESKEDRGEKNVSDGAGHIRSMVLSLCAFNALLYQLVYHIETSVLGAKVGPAPSSSSIERPPYKMSRYQIGQYDLQRLREGDDPGWSAVVQCIASNLKWLAENAGSFDPM